MDFSAHLSLPESPRSHVIVSIPSMHNLSTSCFWSWRGRSGCEGWQEIEDFGTNKLDWLRKYRLFASGIPTRHSIARIIKGVKVELLVRSLFAWGQGGLCCTGNLQGGSTGLSRGFALLHW